MRVLIDGRGLLEELKAGVEGYTWQMINYLQRMYPEDEYILFSYSWNKQPDEDQRRLFEWVHYRWPNIVMTVSWPWFGYPRVDEMVNDVDVVWVPNVRFMPTSNRVIRVATVHDLSFEAMPSCFSYKRRLWHWHMQIKRNLEKMDRIVVVSQATRQDLINYYAIDESKIKTIHSGINLTHSTDKLSDVKKKYDLNNYILAIGTIEPRKNLSGLIKAYRYYLDHMQGSLPLVLVGGQGWDHEISRLVRKLNLQEWVKFLGFVSEEEKFALISEADILAFVSFYEGFGFPPLEAMMRGVPVMASHGGSLGEILGDGALMVDPIDTVAMASGLEQLSNQTELRQKFIRQGLKVVEKYNWINTVTRFRRELAGLVVEKAEVSK